MYRENIARRALRGGDVGMKTRRERRVFWERVARDLHAEGYELRRPENLSGKHLRALWSIWLRRELQPATLATYASHLRTGLGWLGKDQLQRMLDRLVSERPDLTHRQRATTRDRSAQGAGVQFDAVLARAKGEDEHFACQLALIQAFGLRSQEAWLFRPHLAEEGGRIHANWGTKGGRPRVLPGPITAEQRVVLTWAKSLALTRAESMIPRGFTVQRWRRRYYHLCSKIGLTRRELTVTPHSLRHGVLLDRYEQLAGVPAAVRGGTLAQEDPAADRAVRTVVAEMAGHSRPAISAAYLGSPRQASAKPRLLRRTPESPECTSSGDSSAVKPGADEGTDS